MRTVLIAGAMLATAACATAGTGPNQPVQHHAGHQQAAPAAPASGPCDAARVQGHVGHPYRDMMGAQIQQQAGGKALRVLRPGDAATMDYRSDRLNIDLDTQNRISAVRCG